MPRKLIIYNTMSEDATAAQEILAHKFQDDDDRVTLIGCTPASLIVILEKVLLLATIDKVFDRIVVLGCNPTIRCCRLLERNTSIDHHNQHNQLKASVTQDDIVIFDKQFVTTYDLFTDKKEQHHNGDELTECFKCMDRVYCDKDRSLQDCVRKFEHMGEKPPQKSANTQ